MDNLRRTVKSDLINNNKDFKSNSPSPNQQQHDQTVASDLSNSPTSIQQKRACSVPHGKITTNNINNSNQQSESPPVSKTPPVIERFSKLKILKQKSLMYEIFARSSSASFERQGSCDSGTCSHSNPHSQAINQKITFSKYTNLRNTSIIVPSTSSLNGSIVSSNYMNNCLNGLNFNSTNKRLITPFKPPFLFSLLQTKGSNAQAT